MPTDTPLPGAAVLQPAPRQYPSSPVLCPLPDPFHVAKQTHPHQGSEVANVAVNSTGPHLWIMQDGNPCQGGDVDEMTNFVEKRKLWLFSAQNGLLVESLPSQLVLTGVAIMHYPQMGSSVVHRSVKKSLATRLSLFCNMWKGKTSALRGLDSILQSSLQQSWGLLRRVGPCQCAHMHDIICTNA